MNERSEFSDPGGHTTFKVSQFGEQTMIFEVKGDGGEHSTFEEAKELAIFCFEETIENCQDRLKELRHAETFEEYELGHMRDPSSAAQSRKAYE